MTLSAEWRALQREAQLAAEQIASGVTVLGRANHAQTGLYSQAFFGLSIGIERLGKLIVVTDHAISSGGAFPTDDDLRRIGHDLSNILSKCEAIGATINQSRPYALRPSDPIHQGIVETLSEFATKSRYYNLDYIAGAIAKQRDPIAMWWDQVAKPICDRHYSESQREKDALQAATIAEVIGNRGMVLHHQEDGTEIRDAREFFHRRGVTAIVQKYGRLYTLQLVRWLASILSELAHRGAYKERIEPLLGLGEPFGMFGNDDKYLRDRKTWSIYRP